MLSERELSRVEGRAAKRIHTLFLYSTNLGSIESMRVLRRIFKARSIKILYYEERRADVWLQKHGRII
jgi:hypothetical protein